MNARRQPDARNSMTHPRRSVPMFIALFALLGCDAETKAPPDDRRAEWVHDTTSTSSQGGEAESGASEDSQTDGAQTDGADQLAPNCPPGKELEDVSCDYRLTGSSNATPCRATLAAVLPDGQIEVTAEDSRDCICEYNSPGFLGDEAAECSELNPNYEDPNVGTELCLAMRYRFKPHFSTRKTGTGATYDEAEMAALASCEADAGAQCMMICSRLTKLGAAPAKRSITCCVPSTEEADEPADEPSDAPADEPADAPADEPADTPADEPAADPLD